MRSLYIHVTISVSPDPVALYGTYSLPAGVPAAPTPGAIPYSPRAHLQLGPVLLGTSAGGRRVFLRLPLQLLLWEGTGSDWDEEGDPYPGLGGGRGQGGV